MPKKLLPRHAKLRASGLLDMLYTPAELAEDLGIEKRAVYERLIPAGLPHTKDGDGRVWIHGPEAARWILESGRVGKVPLAENEVYCMRCQRAVPLIDPKRIRSKAINVSFLKSTCPVCGAAVYKGTKA